MRRALLSVALFASACSGSNPGTDAGSSDSGAPDAGAADAGGTDAGSSTDAGCPDAGFDTWCNWANGFFVAYCDSCHTPGQQGDPTGQQFDFTGYADVQLNAATIRCGVAVTQSAAWSCSVPAQQFPIGSGPKPTDLERNRLVAWIDAGAPP